MQGALDEYKINFINSPVKWKFRWLIYISENVFVRNLCHFNYCHNRQFATTLQKAINIMSLPPWRCISKWNQKQNKLRQNGFFAINCQNVLCFMLAEINLRENKPCWKCNGVKKREKSTFARFQARWLKLRKSTLCALSFFFIAIFPEFLFRKWIFKGRRGN